MYKIPFSILFILHILFGYAQLPKLEKYEYKKVELLPANYNIPTLPLSNVGSKTKQIWVVYSDKSENAIYSEKESIKVISYASFLDSFFVISVAGDMFELVKHNALLISVSGKIVSPDKIEYIGWINKSNLLLNEKSYVESKTLHPFKYVSILNGSSLFPNTITTLNYNQINVYGTPELKSTQIVASIKFNEIVYAYKFQKDKVLIGKAPQFDTKNGAQIILGWVSTSFIQNWGTRLNFDVSKPENMDTLYSYFFPAKNLAMNYESNGQIAIPLVASSCNLSNPFWNKHPVFSVDFLSKNNEIYKLIETGACINPFDNNNAYVYSLSGAKIDHMMLCALYEKSKHTNIVIALNIDDDVKEYYSGLIETFQELDSYFSTPKEGTYTFSFINTADNSYTKIITKDHYYELLPILIDIIKEHVQFTKTASAYGILNGLTSATNYFSKYAGENNVLLMISTQGDYAAGDNVYKSKFDKVALDMANTHARAIMYQPYASSGTGYSNFIPQSKMILKKYADKSVAYTKPFLITNNENASQNNFKSLESGISNIYCLDYPENANTQGFISFPTIGSKIDKKNASKTIDSLLHQMNLETTIIEEQIRKTFNSSSVFNTHRNSYFEKYYNMYSSLPRNLELESKNINFNYFAKGFAIQAYEPHSTKKNYQQYLLLNQQEYIALADIFKSLKIDQLLLNPNEINKKFTQEKINELFKERICVSKNSYKNPSLKDFFYEVCGYQTDSKKITDCPISNIFTNTLVSKDVTYQMLGQIKKSFDAYYELKNNPNITFQSHQILYYWINENKLP